MPTCVCVQERVRELPPGALPEALSIYGNFTRKGFGPMSEHQNTSGCRAGLVIFFVLFGMPVRDLFRWPPITVKAGFPNPFFKDP